MERVVIPPYDEYDLSTVVVNGDEVHVGHVGGTVDEAGEPISSIEGQTHRTLDNLETYLAAIDLGLDDVAKLTVILDDIEDFHAMHAVWMDRFSEGNYPARAVITSEFVNEDVLVQVEGTACR